MIHEKKREKQKLIASKEKYFYLHIPKTAGSSMNKFLTAQFGDDDSLTHIESKIDFQDEESVKLADTYRLLSGHVVLPQMQHKLKALDTRTTIATFRIPWEHTASHIAWVRKLADPGEEVRLRQHNATIQEIAAKFAETDLSDPAEITQLIQWLEEKKYYLFHNVQTKYLGGGDGYRISPHQINQALLNLNRIDFVGTTERLDELLSMLCYRLGWKAIQDTSIRENVNANRYGMNIQDPAIREALLPLIQWDSVIYRIARERFIDDMHKFLAEMEKSRWPKFSSVRDKWLLNQFK